MNRPWIEPLRTRATIKRPNDVASAAKALPTTNAASAPTNTGLWCRRAVAAASPGARTAIPRAYAVTTRPAVLTDTWVPVASWSRIPTTTSSAVPTTKALKARASSARRGEVADRVVVMAGPVEEWGTAGECRLGTGDRERSLSPQRQSAWS